jgi:serine/threonine protein kinase/Flp pilus assembly protein TadD/TolB-like protein
VSLERGTSIGPYEIVAPIGAGGMGEVYRARDTRLDREIAVKVLSPELASSSEHLRRFEQEARAASSLNHPNIIAIYDVGREGDYAYIAMELIEGRDVRALTADGPVPLKTTLRIAAKVADGLAAAHGRGIVHRDLKPENIIVSSAGYVSNAGQVKILDFGLAKLVRPLSATDATLPHTHPGAVFGTVGYMSPEQASGLQTDFRSDHFSFGVILYELLTGKRPFDEPTAAETMAAIIRTEPRPVGERNPSVPPDLQRIVTRLLSKEPLDRYGSTLDLARDLRELRDQLTMGSGRRSSAPKLLVQARKRAAPLAAIVTGFALLGVVTWYALHSEQSARAASAKSLAVLPFRDLSGVPNGQNFADGMAETISARLAQANALRIATLFDGNDKGSLADVARRAKADLLLRGSVQRSGNQVRVTYALVDPHDGEEIAGDTITGAADAAFTIEDSIADAVLQKVHAKSVAAARPDRLSGRNQAAYLEAVGLLQKAKDEKTIDDAVAKLEKLLVDDRDSATVNAQLARALIDKNRLSRKKNLLDDAILYAERAAQFDPRSPEALVALGLARHASGRSQEAVEAFEKALTIQPNAAEAYAGLGEALQALGRASDAETAYRHAIVLRPEWPSAYTLYGTFCFRRGRFADALAQYQRAARILPDAARSHTNVGAALANLGRIDDARTSYRKALSIAPSSTLYVNLGSLEFERAHFLDAAKAFEQATTLTGNDFRSWEYLGDAYRWSETRKNDAANAYRRTVETARIALASNPKDANARGSLARALAKLGNADEARREIRAALDLDPTNGRVLYSAGVVAALTGDADAAVTWLHRATDNGFARRDIASDPYLAALKSRPDSRRSSRPKRRKVEEDPYAFPSPRSSVRCRSHRPLLQQHGHSPDSGTRSGCAGRADSFQPRRSRGHPSRRQQSEARPGPGEVLRPKRHDDEQSQDSGDGDVGRRRQGHEARDRVRRHALRRERPLSRERLRRHVEQRVQRRSARHEERRPLPLHDHLRRHPDDRSRCRRRELLPVTRFSMERRRRPGGTPPKTVAPGSSSARRSDRRHQYQSVRARFGAPGRGLIRGKRLGSYLRTSLSSLGSDWGHTFERRFPLRVLLIVAPRSQNGRLNATVRAERHRAGHRAAPSGTSGRGPRRRYSALRKWLRKCHLRPSVFDVTGSPALFVLFL